MSAFASKAGRSRAATGRPTAAGRLLSAVPPGGLYAVAIIALSIWILHNFLLPFLVACVTAIASWPLYQRIASRLGGRVKRGAIALGFTTLITVFVLAPLMLALGALLIEAHTLLAELAMVDRTGIAMPSWLPDLPLAGSWLAERWSQDLAHPGAIGAWVQRTGPSAFVTWAQSLGQFMARHLFIVGFTILLLFFLYQEGASLARQSTRLLRHFIGEHADPYVRLAIRAVRASVNSMLVVALFDGFATAAVYALVGVPHALLWAASTAGLAILPFLGYAGVLALLVKLVLTGNINAAILAGALGCSVLFCGDKIVRPAVARGGTGLPFVGVLIGCLGGFSALGLVGVVVGPVVLTLARELWAQHLPDLDAARIEDPRLLETALTPVSSRAGPAPSRVILSRVPPAAD
jgi:predicted PurR-regulated permease PerM